MTLITPPELLEAQKYPFQRLRYMNEHLGLQEGVWGANDYKVVQRAAGANMSVDVGAGAAWIKGDTGTRQGLYHLVNDATVNLAVGAAHATLPRIDQVVARIFDSTVSGASDTPTLSILAGTPTSGATLDNRNGAAALPNDAVRVADILVPAADTAITDNQIRDRRPWARGAYAQAGVASQGVTTSQVELGTAFRQRVELSGVPLRVMLAGSWIPGAAGQNLNFGATVGGIYLRVANLVAQSTNLESFALDVEYVPPPGSALFSVTGNVSAGTATLSQVTLSIEELVRQEQDNGVA